MVIVQAVSLLQVVVEQKGSWKDKFDFLEI